MYTIINYKTKKKLKEDFESGIKIKVYQPGPFGSTKLIQGRHCLEGPHYPELHKWYQSVMIKDGIVIKLIKV